MLITEDGTGKPDSECYNTLASADEYFSKRNNAVWAALTEPEKEAALRRASDYILQTYRNRFAGYRTKFDQALDWPRTLVMRDETTDTQFIDTSNLIVSEIYYPPDFIPRELKFAEAELAVRSLEGDLNVETERLTTSEQVGDLRVTYDRGANPNRRFTMVEGYLRQFLKSTSGAAIERS